MLLICFPSSRIEELNSFLSSSGAYVSLKNYLTLYLIVSAPACIIYILFKLLGQEIYHSRQFILFNVHGMNTFKYKNSLARNIVTEWVISLNNRKENSEL